MGRRVEGLLPLPACHTGADVRVIYFIPSLLAREREKNAATFEKKRESGKSWVRYMQSFFLVYTLNYIYKKRGVHGRAIIKCD